MKPEKRRVMVVDDSKLVLERLRFVLERSGHQVFTRDTALGTVSAVLKERPDVLILDVSMPALDGNRLAAVVSDVDGGILIILHSSRDKAELEELAGRAGAHGYIAKTNDMIEFLSEFNRLVFGVQSEAQLALAAVFKTPRM
jgi:CheY-like chemotaxis protein